jgi:hypothetical protein
VPDGPTIILTLKVLVSAVTLLFAGSLVVLMLGREKLHGLINKVFFALTVTTVLGFELILRLGTDVTATFSDEARAALRVHLVFAVPSALLLPVMLISGVKRRRTLHVSVGVAFFFLWVGTFVTGVFFLPHA